MKAKYSVMITILIILTAAAFYCVRGRKAVPVLAQNDWGLRFEKAGEAPVPNAPSEYLSRFDAYWIGDQSKPVLYLTFNAGYENGYTEAVLNTLAEHNVHATFFLTGAALNGTGELVSRMTEQGCAVGCHSYSHSDVSVQSFADFAAELERWNTDYAMLTGKAPENLYRPPSGQLYESNLEHAKALGCKTYFYSCAYADWDNSKQPSEEAALKTLLSRTHNGAVIMLHSTSKTSTSVLSRYITECKMRGYTFEPLDALG